MKILITGISGFVGSNLALKLKDKHEIIGLDVSKSMRSEELKDFVIYYHDIRDSKHIFEVMKETKPDVILHLAGQVSHFKSQHFIFDDLDINVKGMLNILESVRQYCPKCHVIYASSRSVYGFPKYLPINEEHPTYPIDAYGISKLTAEKYCQLYGYHHNLNYTIFRQANLFGPRQQLWTSEFQMIGWIFRCVLLNETFTFYGDGSQTRDFLYIDDLVRAYEIAICNPELVNKQIFNLGGLEYCSWKDVIKYAEEVTGHTARVRYISHTSLRRKLENPHSWLSYSKFKLATGWMPEINVKLGFELMYDYYVKNKKLHRYLTYSDY